MKIRKLNQKGFSHFEAIVLIVVLVLIGAVGTFVYSRMHKSHAGSNCKGQLLLVGSSGQCVKDAQTLSVAFTGIKMPIDGKYGPLTKTNILLFQTKAFPNAKTQWDGKVGPNTWGKLCSLIPLTKTQAVYNAQNDACGSTSFKVPVTPTPTPTPTPSNYGFNAPHAITTDNLGHVWVANYSGNSVTELNANNGSLVQVLNDASYGFNDPSAITTDNLGHVWVAQFGNSNGGFGTSSVAELNAKDGSLVQVLNDASYGFFYPLAITADNLGHVWVANLSTVTELNASNGSLVQVLNDASYGLSNASAITADNLGHVWVADQSNGWQVTEINANDGSLVKYYNNQAATGFNGDFGITSDNLGHIWVANYLGNSVTELNAQDGSLVQIVK